MRHVMIHLLDDSYPPVRLHAGALVLLARAASTPKRRVCGDRGLERSRPQTRLLGVGQRPRRVTFGRSRSPTSPRRCSVLHTRSGCLSISAGPVVFGRVIPPSYFAPRRRPQSIVGVHLPTLARPRGPVQLAPPEPQGWRRQATHLAPSPHPETPGTQPIDRHCPLPLDVHGFERQGDCTATSVSSFASV